MFRPNLVIIKYLSKLSTDVQLLILWAATLIVPMWYNAILVTHFSGVFCYCTVSFVLLRWGAVTFFRVSSQWLWPSLLVVFLNNIVVLVCTVVSDVMHCRLHTTEFSGIVLVWEWYLLSGAICKTHYCLWYHDIMIADRVALCIPLLLTCHK
jgi:hypothetical protein